jgi:hypothetical protein
VSLCFNWAPRHEGVLGEWRNSSTHSLTSELDGGEWSASHLGRFTPNETAPDTHWIGSSIGSRAVLDAVVKRKIPTPTGNRTLEPPGRSPALYRLSYYVVFSVFISRPISLVASQSDEFFR